MTQWTELALTCWNSVITLHGMTLTLNAITSLLPERFHPREEGIVVHKVSNSLPRFFLIKSILIT